MHIKTVLFLTFGAIISVAGFDLAFRHVPFESLIAFTRNVDYRWLLPALIVLAVAYYVRSLRWQLLLRPLDRIPLVTAYHSIIVSLLINCIIPGRMGEIARPLILKKKAGLPFASSLATLAAERLLDLTALLVLLFLALPRIAINTTPTVAFGGHNLGADLLMNLARTAMIGLVVLMIGLVFIGHDGLRQKLSTTMRRIAAGTHFLGPRIHTRIVRIMETRILVFVQHLANGLQYLKTPGNLLAVFLLSLSTWLLNALSFYLVSRGCPDIGLGYADILFVMVIICLFIALPSVPDYWGLWEAAGVFALASFSIAEEPAAGFTLFNHVLQILPVIVAGWISCLIMGFGWSDMMNSSPAPDSSTGGPMAT